VQEDEMKAPSRSYVFTADESAFIKVVLLLEELIAAE
jgi:hypothetical protein